MELEIPKNVPAAMLDAVVREESQRLLGDAVASGTTAWRPIPATPRHAADAAIAVVIPNDISDAIVKSCEQAGIPVRAVACPTLGHPDPTPSRSAAVLTATRSAARVALFERSRLIFERGIDAAGTTLNALEDPTDDAIASYAEALGDGLDRCLRYTDRRFPDFHATEIVVSGEAADLPGLSGAISAAVGIDLAPEHASDNHAKPGLERALRTIATQLTLPARPNTEAHAWRAA